MKKVRILNNCEDVKEIEITQDEINEFDNLVKILDSYFQAEQLLHILIGNYNDYNNVIYSMTQSIFNEGTISKNLLTNITKLNWKLLNLSASFRCYKDQLLGSKNRGRSGIFEEILPHIHKEIISKYNDEKKDNDGLDYLYKFRNEIQHKSLPMKTLDFKMKSVGKDNKRTRLMHLAFHEELFGKEYLKIGSGMQPLFNLHYDIIRKKVYPVYEKSKTKYKEFFNKYTKDDTSILLGIYDEEKPDDIKYPAEDYPERIDDFVKGNPSGKPLTKGWFPGIINIDDIYHNKVKAEEETE